MNIHWISTIRELVTIMAGLLTICAIFQYFGTHKKELKRGENHLESGHVEEYNYNETEGFISGMVHSSWKRVSYKTKVYLDDKRKITSTSCECVEREDACSHAACLALWVNRNISCTDITCSWKKKKRPAGEMTRTIEDVYPGKQHKSLKRTTADIEEDKAQLYRQLVNLKRFSGLMWLLSPEEADEVLPVRTVDELLKCPDVTSITDLDERATRILELMIVSPDRIASVAKLTGDQRNSTAWQKLRCHRLTSSRFGDVLVRKKAWSAKAIHNIAYPADISKVRAIQHGVQNEEAAFKIVQNLLGETEVIHTGLHLNEEGILGASPDGLVGDDAVLEIKCPLSAIPFDNVTRAVELGKLPFLKFDENKQLFLKPNCKYYHQVQGQLYLTGRTKCYFAVYIPREAQHELLLLTVERDEQWKSNLEILSNFYKRKMLPYIISNRD